MTPRLRYGIACTVVLMIVYGLLAAGAQDKEYAIKVMPPGGPAPRLADGHPDLSGHWLPNSAGMRYTLSACVDGLMVLMSGPACDR